MQHGELRSYRGSRLVNELFLQFSSFNLNDTFNQQRHCSTSSWSSSSSPTATSSDNEIREREDRTESDTSPVPVSSFNVDDRTGQPVVCRLKSRKFWNPGVTARIQGKFGGWWSSWTQRLTRQFFSWSIFRAIIQVKCGFGKTQCLYSFP